MTTISPAWLQQYAPHLDIHPTEPITLRGVGSDTNVSTRYVSLSLSFPATDKHGQSVIVKLYMEAHILDTYSGPALVGMDVIVPEGIMIDPTRRLATVHSCQQAAISIQVTTEDHVKPFAVLRAARELVVAPGTVTLVDVADPLISSSCDYMVDPETSRSSHFAYYSAVLNHTTTAVPLLNFAKKPQRIAKGERLVNVTPCTPSCFQPTGYSVTAYSFCTNSATTTKRPSASHTPGSDEVASASPGERTESQSKHGVTVFGDAAQRKQLCSILEKFRVWEDTGETIDIPVDRWMKIPLVPDWQSKINTKPRPYPASPKDNAVINEIFDRLHEQHRMEWSTQPTPFTFPVFVVWRTVLKDGVPVQKGRAVIDIRGLNRITEKDSYPLPSMDEMHKQLAGKRFISVLDGLGWFHQWRIHPDYTHYVSVITARGQETMLVTPMGFKNSVAHVQRQADIELKDHADYARTYVDDTVVFSDTFQDHCQHLTNVLSTFTRLRASLNPLKSYVGFSSVTLLGKRVNALGLSTHEEKVEALLKLRFPQTVKELETYIGLTQWLRHFIPYYAYIIDPLQKRKTKLLRHAPSGKARKSFVAKTAVDKPTEDELAAFNHLQDCFSRPTFLAHHQPARPLFIEVDASKQRGFGGFLYHADLPDNWPLDKPPPRTAAQPILFLSKVLSNPEAKLWPTELETAAVVWVLHQSFKIVQSNTAPVVMFVDHSAVAQLAKQTTMHSESTDRSNIKLARAAEYIQRFDIQIYHRPGRQHIVADALSRLPSRATNSPPNDDLLFTLFSHTYPAAAYTTTLVAMSPEFRDALISGYRTDPRWRVIYEQVKDEQDKGSHDQARLPYKIDDELLYTVNYNQPDRLVIPHNLVRTVLAQAHDQAAHPGPARTLERLRSVCIHRVRRQTEMYIRHCRSCQVNKPTTHQPFGSLQPILSTPIPFHTITIDFVTALPVTANKEDAVLTVTDKFTKRVTFVPGATNWSGTDWGCKLVSHLLTADWGIPAVIISDRDSIFLGQIWQSIFKAYNTKLLTSTAYHPQTDGQSERTNMTAEIALRHVLPALDSPDEWPTILPFIQMALNSSRSATTESSPHEMMYGLTISNPLIHLSRRLFRQPDLSTRLDSLDLANYAQMKSKYYYDLKHKDTSFPVGSLVYVTLHKGYKIKSPLPKKLQPRRIGPFKVLERVGRLAYRLDINPTYAVHPVFSVAQLEPAPSSPDPFHRPSPAPQPITIDGTDDNYEIERILDVRQSRGRTEYLIKWKGYGDEHNVWYDKEDLPRAQRLIKEFHKSQQGPIASRLRKRPKA